jgi:hypothetical protein
MGQLTGESPVNSDSARISAQVGRILRSRVFQNTEVLKRLLECLTRHAIDGDAADLKEYTVGIEAFGKPSDYDPKIDSSVRVQAGKLRQRLDEYYRTEGQSDGLIIELPKGHFKLEVRPRETELAPVPQPAPRRWPVWVGAGALIVIATAAAAWWVRPAAFPSSARQVWTPEMEAFWKPLLVSPRPIMISIGTPLFTKMGNSFFRDPALNTWDAAAQSERVRKVEEAAGEAPLSPAFPYTGIGDAAGAFALERLLLPRGRDLTLQASNLVSWEDINRNNMIFLGPPKFNLQTMDLPVRLDFEISHGRVQNLRPAPGEPESFEEKWAADRSTLVVGHALITRVPGLHRTGDVLILAGSSTESTRAAAEFVTRAEYVTPFVRWMKQTHGGVPAWFQVVIRARFKSLTPIEIDRVAFHELK